MKIVHIISSLQRGGAEMALANLLSQLRDVVDHSVIFFHDGPVRKTIEDLGIPCIHITAPCGYANPLFFIRLLHKVRFFSPDCMHTDLWAANLLGRICARLLDIPCVSVVHAMTEHEGKIRATIDRFFPCSPTTYVAVSEAVKESLQKNKRLHKAPCVVIKNGIDAYMLHHAPRVPTLHSTLQDSFIIGAVGRLIVEKNYAILLRSFAQVCAQHKNIQLMIIGSGPEEHRLKTLAAQLKITDQITWVGNQLAHPYYHFFDIFVQPSRSEGLSIALLEALACSLPVIVTSHNGTHEVIEDRINGLVIKPNDVPALTLALDELIENEDLRARSAADGYATVTQKFSLQETAQEYMQLFKQCP